MVTLAPVFAITPTDIRFTRQASQRMVMDASQSLPLAVLDPKTVIDLGVMHPIRSTDGDGHPEIVDGKLILSSDSKSDTSLWFSGFNPFATYRLGLDSLTRGSAGLEFRHEDGTRLRVDLLAKPSGNIRWSLEKEGKLIEQGSWDIGSQSPEKDSTALVVQMSGVGFNVLLETGGLTRFVGRADVVQHVDFRRKTVFQKMSSWVRAAGEDGVHVSIRQATAALTPGLGQADIRAITDEEGNPLLENGRVWFTATIRGGGLAHPTQGVFSIEPGVFDIRFEGMIAFDRGDGLLRNEVASHLFLHRPTGEWRGWTTGFSAFGDPDKKEKKEILAVRSTKDPRRGFSIMKATPTGLVGDYEDPSGVFDHKSGNWYLLLCQNIDGYKAVVLESSSWDSDFKRLAGPVSSDSTGTTIQKIGDNYYALYGSADRRFHVHTFPDLKPIGELDLDLPPWSAEGNARVWPNVISLPEGYPSPFLLLTFDRANFPGIKGPNWTYGGMHLYQGNPRDSQ